MHPRATTLQYQTLPSSQGGLRRCHVSSDFGPRLPDREGSGVTLCPEAPDPTSLIGRDVVSSRVQ
jgi:hypothetical protein